MRKLDISSSAVPVQRPDISSFPTRTVNYRMLYDDKISDCVWKTYKNHSENIERIKSTTVGKNNVMQDN